MILLIFCFMVPVLASGQKHNITILDQKTGEGIAYAHVCLEKPDGSNKAYYLTDEKGLAVCDIDVPAVLAVSFIGYETLFDTLTRQGDYTFELKPTVFNINEVVVTAQYTPERADKSIYKVNLISSKQIEEKSANNLNDLLGSELNFRVSQDGALGSSLSIQGLSGEHIKFLVDGVPVIGRMNGNIDISQLNLYNVDHVEIIEGPMSVVYGSNALAGVINIITKQSMNGSFRANASTYVESVGVFNFDGLAAFKRKNHNFSISAARNFFNGYSLNDTLRSKRWKPKRQYNVDGFYMYDTKSLKLKFSGAYFNEKLQSKGDLMSPYFETAFDSYFFTHRFSGKLDVVKNFSDHRFLNAVGSYSWYERKKETYFKDLTTLDEILTGNAADHDTTRFDNIMVRATYSKSDNASKVNYQMGLDFNMERGWGKRITDNNQEIGDYAAFMSLKYAPASSITFQPGLRYIYNTKYNAPLVYSLNIRWQPLDNITARASYSRGFRAPSLKELYLYFVDVNHNVRGNEDLESENSHNVNASLSYFREQDIHYVGFELKVFYNNINNIITLAQLANDLYTYVNVDKYITQGFEIETKYKFYPNLDIRVGLVETGRYNAVAEEVDDIKKFNYSTDVITNLHYRFIRWNADLSVFYKYSGRLPQFFVAPDGSLVEGYIEDYNTMDITLQKFLFSNKLVIGGGVKNLFDVKDVAASAVAGGAHSGGSGGYSVGWGRTFFLKLTLNLIKN
ncbi:MAG TPA: TonB-dependent receptor [Bacteroidales bacterium]|nr:TonB-dependent receptor [Bacteroidales bacterium]